MNLLLEMFRRYGIALVVAVVLGMLAVWGMSHQVAEPGQRISVLWGMREYTKKSPHSAADDSRPPGAAVGHIITLTTAIVDKDPVDDIDSLRPGEPF